MAEMEHTDAITALVVDDDAADRKLVRRLIAKTRSQACIHEATSLNAALSIDLPKIDLLFLDYLFPIGTGIDAISDLIARWPGVAIIVMTGHGDEDIAKSAILKGAVDYVPKRTLSENVGQRIIDNGLLVARMRQKIEEQREELSIFADTLVHDLRAPVRSVAFLAEQIAEGLASGEIENVQDELRLMRKSAHQMTNLINSLKEYVELDRVSVRNRVPIGTLLETALAALHHQVRESGAIIRTNFPPLSIECIAPQIAQLLQNLVENAIKYRSTATPLMTITAKQEGASVLFSVVDNGIGVPEEFQSTIFQPFKRIAGRGSQPGSGLGLATCVKIVTRHNGKIWCLSPPEGGTDIRFRIEVKPAELPQEFSLNKAS